MYVVCLLITLLQFSTECACEKFAKSINIWQRYGQKLAAYFLAHPVHLIQVPGIVVVVSSTTRTIADTQTRYDTIR